MPKLKALVFDCDGVLAETERDGHRIAFNRTFKEEKLDVEWSIEEYGELLKIAGGKERMRHYFRNIMNQDVSDDFINKLHAIKTAVFMDMCSKGELPVREGVIRLAKEAHDKGLILSVCSTSNINSVTNLMKAIMGNTVNGWFKDSVFAGDVVKAKKPSPDIYNLMREKYKLKGEECFVVEDNRNGLLAAKNAGMYCIVTVSYYSVNEQLSEADLVVSSLGEPHSNAIKVHKNNLKLKNDVLNYITINHLMKISNHSPSVSLN